MASGRARAWGYRKKRPPAGWDYIEPTMTALANELREANTAGHGGKQRHEAMWPIHQINNQRSRYIYDMFYVHRKISRKLYDYCLKQKLADADLIAKWKKPGYEKLCSTFVINPRNFPFGTTAICRVPPKKLQKGKVFYEAHTGCRGCASGAGGHSNIFGNKYGQSLADIQLLREQQLEKEFASGQTRADDGEARLGEEATSSSSSHSTLAGPWAAMESSSDEEDSGGEESDGENDDDGGGGGGSGAVSSHVQDNYYGSSNDSKNDHNQHGGSAIVEGASSAHGEKRQADAHASA